MILTKRALPRRTILRGAGAALALPLLDAMIPAATALEQTPAKPVRRLGYVFMPMGCDNSRWIPSGGEKLEELSPILSSLEPVKQDITVISNMELAPAYPGSHATSNSAFLSCAKPRLPKVPTITWGPPPTRLPPSRLVRKRNCRRWNWRWTC